MRRTLFQPDTLPADIAAELAEFCRQVRGDIIRMTSVAGSGHPGGSMSSTEILALLWSQADVDPADPGRRGRDRIVVSHGHVSPVVYSVLGRLGFFDPADAVRSFRQAGSPFEGHAERSVPGVELTTGNLGQGLSGACGFALADRLSGISNHVWVVMGDGEQQKGQIAEARRFAKARGISNLTAIVDLNGLQISGRTADVMPQDLAAEYRASGWEVHEVDGHDLEQLYVVLRKSKASALPSVVLARTVMGRGVSFMENDPQFHGRAPTREEAAGALSELGLPDDIDGIARERAERDPSCIELPEPCTGGMLALTGSPRTYPASHRGDNRSAFGQALLDMAEANRDDPPIVFDCDLAGSVKTLSYASRFPDHFFQSGIMEHHTASMAGAASLTGKVVFWADFGVFATDETFNQHRLNDINMTGLKVVATHCGLDVGPDGKTHHCIKYLSLTGTLRHCSVIVPADPNQTDRAVRFAATNPGNFLIAMGRSKTPVITREDGSPLFGDGYGFVYGLHDKVRKGSDTAIVALGPMTARAVEAAELLGSEGVSCAVFCVSCPLCISPDFLSELAGFSLVASLEDHDADSGLGSRMALAQSGRRRFPPLLRLGVEGYGLSGEPEDLYRRQGLTAPQIARRISERLASKDPGGGSP